MYTLSFTGEGYLRLLETGATTGDVSSIDLGELEMKGYNHQISGTVLDWDGKPLKGVHIDVWTGSEAMTDAAGQFTLTSLPRGESLESGVSDR